jgi:hypothetical protein
MSLIDHNATWLRYSDALQHKQRAAIPLDQLLDHLVGQRQQFVRNGEAERLRGLHIDD